MAQQTAVEFVIEKYEKFINSENGSGERYFYDELVKDIEQARVMEKEQTIEFTKEYISNECYALDNVIEFDSSVEQYYNETYNKA